MEKKTVYDFYDQHELDLIDLLLIIKTNLVFFAGFISLRELVRFLIVVCD